MINQYKTPSTKLNRRAEVWHKAKSTQRDALGQYPVYEQKLATVWAGVTPQTGSLLTGRVADTAITTTTHKVIIRYRPDIRPDMWLVIDGERYDVLYILDPYLAHETLELFCEVVYD